MKDGGHHYFISSLDVNEPGMSPDSRAQAAFVLAVICDGHKRGRLVCGEQGLLQKLLSLLSNMVRARQVYTAQCASSDDCGLCAAWTRHRQAAISLPCQLRNAISSCWV